MKNKMKLTLGQLNPILGDFAANYAKARAAYDEAIANGSNFIALPEMFLSGYPPQDLVFRRTFNEDVMAYLTKLAQQCVKKAALGIGAPLLKAGKIYNAYFILKNGTIQAIMHKHELPNSGVFDEKRFYVKGDISAPFMLDKMRIGVPICEDAWHSKVCFTMANMGVDIFVIPNGSPYYRNKFIKRIDKMRMRVAENNCPLVYLNMVGGQDDLVFDGGSFVLNRDGHVAVQLPLFESIIAHVNFEYKNGHWRALAGQKAILVDDYEQDYRAMVLALRDYMGKSGFKKAVIGLSGGVDSALVACIAADALGANNLRCVMLASEFTSQRSHKDAMAIAQSLGCNYNNFSITAARKVIGSTLAKLLPDTQAGVTSENIQARLRAILLMAISNARGEMLLSTSNKSEIAVGYGTLYGDMAGGYNPIKDLYKMRLYQICHWRNQNYRNWMRTPKGNLIPASILKKPPSAELRENQKDSDSLPDYAILDAILKMLVDQDKTVADIVMAGFNIDIVKQVQHLVYRCEYKRFQSPPGPRLSCRAFWSDRRYPMVNRWRDSGD